MCTNCLLHTQDFIVGTTTFREVKQTTSVSLLCSVVETVASRHLLDWKKNLKPQT